MDQGREERVHPAVSCETRNGCHPHLLYSPDLKPCDFLLLFPKYEIEAERTPV
jgi:hypothetical protein